MHFPNLNIKFTNLNPMFMALPFFFSTFSPQQLGSFQETERASIAKAVKGQILWIGIKKLLMLIEMAAQVRKTYFIFAV